MFLSSLIPKVRSLIKLKKKIATLNVGVKSEYEDFFEFPDFANYANTKDKLDVVFILLREAQPELKGTKVGSTTLGDGQLSFINNNYKVIVDYREKQIKVTASVMMTTKQFLGKKLRSLYRLYSYEYESMDARLSRGFIYYVINPVLQLMFVRNGTSFIHGSTISYKGNNAYLFTGWGGSGKTSTSSALLFDDKNYKFISDDLAIINEHKNVFNNPAISHIYPYNVVGFETLENNILKGKSFIERLHWSLRKRYMGMNKVRRRVDPNLIYSVNDKVGLLSSKVFYFMRSDAKSIEHRSLTSKELVQMSINVTYHEIKGLTEIFSSMYSIAKNELRSQNEYSGFSQIFGVDNDYFEKLNAIYTQYFDGQDMYYINVPKKTAPKELRDYLTSNELL